MILSIESTIGVFRSLPTLFLRNYFEHYSYRAVVRDRCFSSGTDGSSSTGIVAPEVKAVVGGSLRCSFAISSYFGGLSLNKERILKTSNILTKKRDQKISINDVLFNFRRDK